MIRQLFIQLLKKRNRFAVSAIILFLAFFVFVVIANFGFLKLYKSFLPQLPVGTKDRITMDLNWNYDKLNQKPAGLEDQFYKRLLLLDGVMSADFGFTDPTNIFDISRGNLNNEEEDETLIFCGTEFGTVFDLNLASGRWFTVSDKSMHYPPAVITTQHAHKMGIGTVGKDTYYNFISGGSGRDSMVFEVVGIVDNIPDMHKFRRIEKGAFPVFVPTYSSKLNIPVQSLLIKVRPGTDPGVFQQELDALVQKTGFNEYLFGYENRSIDDLIKGQVLKHFEDFKLIYGVLLILISYILISIFGNFWKMTQKRTVEIGIRRALGHTRGNVVFYILAESLLLLVMVLTPATFIYLNLYSTIKIAAPLAVYLISSAMLFFIVLLATIIPAVYAGRIHPVQALAEE
jgi:ABC-type antimicrobial peptide transport system permease subunit